MKRTTNQVSKRNKKFKFNTKYQLPLEVIANVMQYLDSISTFNMIQTCQDFLAVYRFLRKDSLEEIKLGYLNKTRTQSTRILNYFDLPKQYQNYKITKLGVSSEYDKTMRPYVDKSSLWGVSENLDAFKKKFNCYLNGNDKDLQMQCIDWMFSMNKGMKQKFVVAGGSIFKSLFMKKNENPEIGCLSNTDIDIFFISNGESEEKNDEKFSKLFSMIDSMIKEQGILTSEPTRKQCITLNNNVIQIHFKDSPDMQFIMRKINTIEELFSMFDLDCCKFAYDGMRVYTMDEAIKSVYTKVNIVPKKLKYSYKLKERMWKYYDFGIRTIFINLHPFSHLFTFAQHLENMKNYFHYSKKCDHGIIFKNPLKEHLSDAKHGYSDNSSTDDSLMYDSIARFTYGHLTNFISGGLYGLIQYIKENCEYDLEFRDCQLRMFLENLLKGKTNQLTALKAGYTFESISLTNVNDILQEWESNTYLEKKHCIHKCEKCNQYFINYGKTPRNTCFNANCSDD
jgi:hypothetical protein